jgi:hypothetical protein
LKPVWDGDGFDDYTFSLQNLYALQPNQGSIELNSVISNRKAATKIIFYKQIFLV